jgi:hypothetical protein
MSRAGVWELGGRKLRKWLEPSVSMDSVAGGRTWGHQTRTVLRGQEGGEGTA